MRSARFQTVVPLVLIVLLSVFFVSVRPGSVVARSFHRGLPTVGMSDRGDPIRSRKTSRDGRRDGSASSFDDARYVKRFVESGDGTREHPYRNGLQAAIDALPPSGGKVVLPRGVVALDTQVRVDQPVHLVGHGRAYAWNREREPGPSRVVFGADADSDAFLVQMPLGTERIGVGVVFEDFHVRDRGRNDASGFFLDGEEDSPAARYPDRESGVADVTFRNVSVSNFHHAGIWARGQVFDVHLIDTWLNRNGNGLLVEQSSVVRRDSHPGQFIVRGGWAYGNLDVGYDIEEARNSRIAHCGTNENRVGIRIGRGHSVVSQCRLHVDRVVGIDVIGQSTESHALLMGNMVRDVDTAVRLRVQQATLVGNSLRGNRADLVLGSLQGRDLEQGRGTVGKKLPSTVYLLGNLLRGRVRHDSRAIVRRPGAHTRVVRPGSPEGAFQVPSPGPPSR